MSKKFVISSFVLVLLLVAAAPSWALMGYQGEPNLHGQFDSHWPNFNNVDWSLWNSGIGQPPKAKTSDDPNQLPGYNGDFGTGTIRVFFALDNGKANCQTFSTDANTDGFALTRIAVRISGAGSTIADENYPYSVHIFDLCNMPGQIPPTWGQYRPSDGIPYSGKYDFLSAPTFVADPCLVAVGSNDNDILLHLDFNEYDGVDLEPGHTYAFEIWGPYGWTATPPWVFGMVWNTLENTGPEGCGYTIAGTRDDGDGPGPSVLTNYRTLGLGGADYDFVVAVYGDSVDGNAYHPSPRKYQTGVELRPTLTWHPGKWADVNTTDSKGGHRVWFSTSFNKVAQRQTPAYVGNLQEPTWTPTADLALKTNYYWRVDEFNDVNTVPVPCPNHPGEYYWGEPNNVAGETTFKKTIYCFTTISPAASNPYPAQKAQATFKIDAAALSWTQGAKVQSTNGHKVYFSVSYDDVLNASDTAYFGTTTDPCYPLENLEPNYILTSNSVYYWRVDEVNGVNLWTGDVWMFRMPNPAFIYLDNLDYATSSAFNQAWESGYSDNGGSISVAARVMTMNYDNTGLGAFDNWSEAKLDYTAKSSSPVDLTVGGVYEPKAIGVQFDGAQVDLNTIDATTNKIYLGLEDSAGDKGFVYLNSDIYAAQRHITIDSGNAATREFKVALNDSNFSSVDLADINRVYLGIGPRGHTGDSWSYNKGVLQFANLKLYVQHCNPSYPTTSMINGDLEGPVLGDITGYHTRFTKPDCIVNLHDMFFLASDWLFNEPNLVWGSASDPTVTNLECWYKFDETSGTTVADSSGKVPARNGKVYNQNQFTWANPGHDGTGKCINLEPGYHTWVQCPNTVVANVAGQTGQSFTFWLKYDDRFNEEHTWSSVLVFHSNDPNVRGNTDYGDEDNQTIETQLPVPWQPAGQSQPWLRWVDMRIDKETGIQQQRFSMIASRWNHYALVYDTANTVMKIYVNGLIVSEEVDAAMTTVWGPAIAPRTAAADANCVRIGTRSNREPSSTTRDVNNILFWQGRIDDMRLYSKALSENEIRYLASDGTGTRKINFTEPDNYNGTAVTLPVAAGGYTVQIINFNDFAKLAEYWATNKQQYQLWP